MTITDIIVIIALILLMANGAYDGFFRALVWPLTMLSTYTLALIVFNTSANLFSAAIVGAISPIPLKLILHWSLMSLPGYQNKSAGSLLSSLCGSLLTLTWGGIFVLTLVVIVAMAPLENYGLAKVSQSALKSTTFSLLRPILLGKTHATRTKPLTGECPTCAENQAQLAALLQEPSIQELLSDPKVQQALLNTDLQAAIQSRDIKKIMDDPLIKQLKNDPSFIAKFMSAYVTIRANYQE